MGKHIIFVIARYSNSGVPLAQIRLARAFARRGFKIEFVIGFVPPGLQLPDELPFAVIELGQGRTYKLLGPLMSMIKSKRPDVIFSAEDHLNAIVLAAVILCRSRTKLSISSRIPPEDTYFNHKSNFLKKRILKTMNQALWWRADALVCVSKDMVERYRKIFGNTRHQAIYNVIVDSDLKRKSVEAVDHLWFKDQAMPIVIAAGRLDPEKGFPDLIAAMTLVNEKISARLVILGEGCMRPELESLIAKAGLIDRAELLGFQSNPYKFFSRSRVFVLSSYAEGLPSVLIEAMACGCRIVSTDCPTGPREVLRDGKIGALIPVGSPRSMADAIIHALGTPRNDDLVSEAIIPFTEEQVVNAHQRSLMLP